VTPEEILERVKNGHKFADALRPPGDLSMSATADWQIIANSAAVLLHQIEERCPPGKLQLEAVLFVLRTLSVVSGAFVVSSKMQPMQKTIYLCGGINGLSDSDSMDWREATKVALSGKFTFLDPMRRDYRGKEDDNVAEIVAGDLADIAASDIILVAGDRPSWGTAMECFHGASIGKRVATVCGGRVSPWLRHHSEVICPSFQAAWEVLGGWA